jgi:hypothetical protein
MPVDRDKFLAELDALTDEEIERRLPQWDREQLALVQQYIDQRTLPTRQEQQRDPRPLEQAQKDAKGDGNARDVALAALALAKRSSTVAVSALILSVGAMFAALIAGLIAYLVLKN